MSEKLSNPLHSRQKPCGHEVHPAIIKNYSSLYGRQCSCCRMNNAMFDVRRSQELILGNGGVEEWREKCLHDQTMMLLWERTIRGANKRGRKPIINIHGHDGSYRYSKTRLLNLAIELEALSTQEKEWESEQQPEIGSPANSPKKRRMQYSATNAMALYNGAIETGVFAKLEEDCTSSMRKRGRDYEASAHPDYPDSDSEHEDARHRYFDANAAQRAFINASFTHPTNAEDQDTSLPKRKRRRIDASVTYNEDVYIRSENDVDALRYAAIGLDAGFLEDDSPHPLPPSILRTAPLVIDSRPRRAYRRRGLKKYDGALRPDGRWDRRSKGYQPGAWAVGKGSEIVNTSGKNLGYLDWEDYCGGLEEEGEEMDIDMAMAMEREVYVAKGVGDDEAQGGNEEPVEFVEEELEIEEVGREEEEFNDEEVWGERNERKAVDSIVQPVLETVKVKGLAKAITAFPHARSWQW